MKSFDEVCEIIYEALREAGYPSARVEIHLHPTDIDIIQREESVMRAIVAEGCHPTMRQIGRFTHQPIAIVHGVQVYMLL